MVLKSGGGFFGKLVWFFRVLGVFRGSFGVFWVGFSVSNLGGLGKIGGDK